jgi:hypothetical protein
MQRQLFEHHPVFGHRFVPGLKARIDHEGGGYLLRVNEAGFRCDHEFVAQKRPGTFRVLLFGDSYTAGDGVSNRDRYGDALEHLVPSLEVYNFGLSGSGTDQQYLIFRELARTLEHDAIIISVLVENIRRVAAQYREYASQEGQKLVMAKPYFTHAHDGTLELHHVPVPSDPIPESAVSNEADIDRGGRYQWLREAVNRMGPSVKDIAQRVSHYQPLPQYDSSDTPEWRLLRAILLKWIGESKRPVILCPIPLYQYVEDTASSDGYRARFRELAKDSGAILHDPLDDFRKFPLDARRGFRFKNDCHLTPAAHKVLAQSLASTLRELQAKTGAEGQSS